VVSGSCLCGAVEFELQPSRVFGPGRETGVCHCTSCQRWSGAPSLPFVVALPERFRVTNGVEQLAHYRDKDSTMRAFCRRCGSGLYQEIGALYYVSAGALRDVAVQPEPHLRPGHQAPSSR